MNGYNHFVITRLEYGMLNVFENNIYFFILGSHVSETIQVKFKHSVDFLLGNRWTDFQVSKRWSLCISQLEFFLLHEIILIFRFNFTLFKLGLEIFNFLNSLTHISCILRSESQFFYVDYLSIDFRERNVSHITTTARLKKYKNSI
jgi:hypothetical protein